MSFLSWLTAYQQGETLAADPTSLSLGDPGMCGIPNTEKEAPKQFSL